jgi:hypothetical protein
LTRLQRGMVVEWRGAKWRVVLVNECRAVLRKCYRRLEVIRDRFGKERKVREKDVLWSVSPNAELPIVKQQQQQQRCSCQTRQDVTKERNL